MSIYDLSLLLPYVGKNDYKENLLMLGVDVENEELLSEIKDKSEYLGNHGWVVSPYVDMELGDNLNYIDIWTDFINNNNECEIEKYFIDNDYALLRYILGRSVLDIITFECYKYSTWYKEATANFFDEKYVSCIFALSALIEGIIRRSPIDKWERSLMEFYINSTEKILNSTNITKCDDKYTFIIEKCCLSPSVIGFIKRYYSLKKENQFGNKGSWEPHFLNRHWLMHGMTDRTVSRMDCIQLFNALASLLAIKTDMTPT